MTGRPGPSSLDAIVVGSGPNGLAAAIALAQAGHSVRVYEAQAEAGGGLRSLPLTAPGFTHDVCATVHAVAVASPFLSRLPLDRYGFELAHPPAPFAHPLDDGTAVVVERSIDATAASLRQEDGKAYAKLMRPLVDRSAELFDVLLRPPSLRHPLLMARFGIRAIQPATTLARWLFRDERTRALFAGVAAHSVLPLDYVTTAGFGITLGVAAHSVGWPVARGGSQALARAMVAYLQALGGEVITGTRVDSLDALPASRAVLCDVSPRQLVAIAGERLPARYRQRIQRFRYGPGLFKIDWSLSAPVPWRAEGCRRAGTVHLGGTLAEIADSESAAWEGREHEKPYVLLVQPTSADPTRAPPGKHVLWGYAHVPHGTTIDFRDRIEAQIERFAPGFRDCILARHVMAPADLEARNPNLIGGDITGGANDLRQVWTRPVWSLDPYTTPARGLFLCSASTPPGVGVHGMCGYNAAQRALRFLAS